jgi:hypothetical protein
MIIMVLITNTKNGGIVMTLQTLENEKLLADAEIELGKFFNLAGEGISNLLMPQGIIDEVWHEKLKDNEKYLEFCFDHANAQIDHVETNGTGELEWVENYEKKFGKLNQAWFVDKNGVLDFDTYQEYLKNGKLIMSWDCGPILTDTDSPLKKRPKENGEN